MPNTKLGALPASQLLAGLAAVLANPQQSTVLSQVMAANPSRIHFDAKDPSKAMLTQADGSKVEGRILENGEFVPGLATPSASPVESDNPRP